MSRVNPQEDPFTCARCDVRFLVNEPHFYVRYKTAGVEQVLERDEGGKPAAVRHHGWQEERVHLECFESRPGSSRRIECFQNRGVRTPAKLHGGRVLLPSGRVVEE